MCRGAGSELGLRHGVVFSRVLKPTGRRGTYRGGQLARARDVVLKAATLGCRVCRDEALLLPAGGSADAAAGGASTFPAHPYAGGHKRGTLVSDAFWPRATGTAEPGCVAHARGGPW